MSEDKWQPIETAPIWKEVIVFYDGVMCRKSQPNRVTTAVKFPDGKWGLGALPERRNPTHWMPLPFPPDE
tara:strand:+ start:7451 stop:7660 length:210 start_codon:yes stop_codon:yes gene_type:complete